MFKALQSTVYMPRFMGVRTFRTSSMLMQQNSELNQLFEVVKSTPNSQKKLSVDDSLLDVLNNLDSKPSNKFSHDLDLGTSTLMHPRDVAKNIRIMGPNAGRTVDVTPGKLTFGLLGLNNVLRSNRIKLFSRIQKRHIPRAKLRKQQKSMWWRKRFLSGFKDLMAQVKDAKRRGY